jgi:hypothetical protein
MKGYKMARRSLFAVAAAATLVLAACSEREPESTTGPEFAATSTACGFSNSLVTGYFPGSRQSFILSLKQSMADAGQGSENARTYGFQIMDEIGLVSRTVSLTSSAIATGAQLTVALIGCMFSAADAATFTYPTDAVSDFTKALTSASGGAYYVRGGGATTASDRSATIIGTTTPLDATGNLSGIAPSSGSSSANWTSMLSGNGTLVQQGVLFYGYDARAFPTATTPVLYEWATVPSALTFSPVAVVSVCDATPADNPVVFEEAIGVLFFVTSPICDTKRSLTMAQPGWGPRALAARLGRALADVLTPTPLQATMLVATAGGGTTSKLPKSKFGKKSLSSVNVSWAPDSDPGIPSTWNGTTLAQARRAAAEVSATVDGENSAVRFCAYLSGTNNNGFPTALQKEGDQRAAECKNPPNGDPKALSVLTTRTDDFTSLADFGKIWVTKTGTITITLTVASGTAITGTIQSVANVKPALKK